MTMELHEQAGEGVKVEALDSKKVEFGGEAVHEVNQITNEPNSYLETATDYPVSEAIGKHLGQLAVGMTEAFNPNLEAARYDSRLTEAMSEPRFNQSEATQLATADVQGSLEKHLTATTPTINEVESQHVVAAGDTLSKIALQEYGNLAEWPRIYEANKALIGDNPGLIRVGQELVIPPKDGAMFNNIIVPDKPHVDTPPVTPPGGGEGQSVENSPEMLEKVAKLEQKIEALTKDPQGITERNITNNPALDGQRIALKEELADLDRDLLKNRVTPESYNDYTARYKGLHDKYNQVSIGLYKNHVDSVPLQFADKGTLDRLQYNETILNRAVERGASADEVEQLADNSWRDYDDAKMGSNTNHHMAGGFIPNPMEGQAIAASIPDKPHEMQDKAAADVTPADVEPGPEPIPPLPPIPPIPPTPPSPSPSPEPPPVPPPPPSPQPSPTPPPPPPLPV